MGVVTTSYPRESGDPAGHFVGGFAGWLAERGCDVEVVAAGPGATRVNGLAVARVDGRGLFYRGGAPDSLANGGVRTWARAGAFQAGLAAAVARRLARWDRVVSHWVAPSALAVEAARALGAGWRGRHLAIAHSSDVWLLRRSKPGRAALRWVARRADLAYAAPHLADSVAGAVGRVVPMGVDADALRGDRTRGRVRFTLRDPSALFIGRLVPVKGLTMLFESLPPGLDLIVAGEGPMRCRLEQMAPPRVRFVGEVRGEAKADLLAACDLLMLPSLRLPDGREEGTPTVLREALVSGLPVVATRTGGCEALLAGRSGAWLVEPEPAALRATLQRLLDEPGLLASHRNGFAASEHCWSHVGPLLAGHLLEA